MERRRFGTGMATGESLRARRPEEPGVKPPSSVWPPSRDSREHGQARRPQEPHLAGAEEPLIVGGSLSPTAGCSAPVGCGNSNSSPGSWEALENMSLSCEHTGEKSLLSSHNVFALTFHLPLAILN